MEAFCDFMTHMGSLSWPLHGSISYLKNWVGSGGYLMRIPNGSCGLMERLELNDLLLNGSLPRQSPARVTTSA